MRKEEKITLAENLMYFLRTVRLSQQQPEKPVYPEQENTDSEQASGFQKIVEILLADDTTRGQLSMGALEIGSA